MGAPSPPPFHEADDVEREEAGPPGALDGRAEREARGIERAAERGPLVRDGDPRREARARLLQHRRHEPIHDCFVGFMALGHVQRP